ncbi:assimilatory sulfite reductase (NADPH) flavoprotein subunit [Buchnera aphidicola]|uniref:assimilatory sulfite reductase (NADPH) flavoprotein subunit n=1 Tax=Buchnera aphidicola TaxID=9 RepID=UPI003BEF2902
MKKNNLSDDSFPLHINQLQDLKKIIGTSSPLQLAWISGYLWKIANEESIALPSHSKTIKIDKNITIISASQTGNARLLSKKLNDYLTNSGIFSHVVNANDYNFKKIGNEKILILIISTQGEGEPPEEAWSFHRFIMSKKAPKLNNLNYSVFALGDTSYDLFCQAGKDFDMRLKLLGGKPLLDRIDADIEYQDVFEKWSKKLLMHLGEIDTCFSTSSKVSDNIQKNTKSNLLFTKDNPAIASILTNQKITGRYSIKDIHHIEIDITGLNITYQPGDALGVWYKNDLSLVKEILDLLSINYSDKVILNNNSITILYALENYFELTNNTESIVKKYASLIDNNFLKNIIYNKKTLKKYVIDTPFINMIRNYPSTILPKDLIGLLRPLTPRLYSISSSQDDCENEVHITVGVVKNLFNGQFHLGGSSGYLSHFLKEDDKIKIFIEQNNNFRLPLDDNISIIMIGPGTGIAPFRSFIQHRDIHRSKGKNWIFFGNPNFTEDFLYQIEWQNYIKKGVLTKFTAAWSRDQKEKIYIQDIMRNHSKDIWSWIQSGAYIYVCGNASKMAKDVEQCLIEIICENTGMNHQNSCEFLNNLRGKRRYQRDVY